MILRCHSIRGKIKKRSSPFRFTIEDDLFNSLIKNANLVNNKEKRCYTCVIQENL